MVCSTAAFMLASFTMTEFISISTFFEPSLVPLVAFRSSAPYSSYSRLGLPTRKWRFLSGQGRCRKFHVLSPQEPWRNCTALPRATYLYSHLPSRGARLKIGHRSPVTHVGSSSH